MRLCSASQLAAFCTTGYHGFFCSICSLHSDFRSKVENWKPLCLWEHYKFHWFPFGSSKLGENNFQFLKQFDQTSHVPLWSWAWTWQPNHLLSMGTPWHVSLRDLRAVYDPEMHIAMLQDGSRHRFYARCLSKHQEDFKGKALPCWILLCLRWCPQSALWLSNECLDNVSIVHACMHACMHTCIRAYMHIHTHTHTHTYMHCIAFHPIPLHTIPYHTNTIPTYQHVRTYVRHMCIWMYAFCIWLQLQPLHVHLIKERRNHETCFFVRYCWCKRSCTTWDVWNLNPPNTWINYLLTGAGFLPSTVHASCQGGCRCWCWDWDHVSHGSDVWPCGSCACYRGMGWWLILVMTLLKKEILANLDEKKTLYIYIYIPE